MLSVRDGRDAARRLLDLAVRAEDAAPFSSVELAAAFAALPDPALVVREDHRILAVNRACARLLAAPEELVGRLCYEVLHRSGSPCGAEPGRCPGELCPFARYRATGERGRLVHVHRTPRGEEHHEVSIYPLAPPEAGAGGAASSFLAVLRPVPVASPRPHPDQLVGRSPAFRRMLELMLRVAPHDLHVLLLGEVGTGKEQVARAIHRLSHRSRRPFVAVYCAGLSSSAFAGELLGRRAGEDAGDCRTAPGKVEAAAGGTLYLDDVGALAPAGQAELARLLKSPRRPSKAGGAVPVPCCTGDVEGCAAEVRLICGAWPDLRRRVVAGTFSRDLYYRLNVFPIELPPLRERPEDLPLLARSFLRQLHGRHLSLHPSTLVELAALPFPGNLRELRALLEHASLEADGDVILPAHLPPES